MKYIIIQDCELCRFFSVFRHGKSKVGFRCNHPAMWTKSEAIDRDSIKFPKWCPLNPIEMDSDTPGDTMTNGIDWQLVAMFAAVFLVGVLYGRILTAVLV